MDESCATRASMNRLIMPLIQTRSHARPDAVGGEKLSRDEITEREQPGHKCARGFERKQ